MQIQACHGTSMGNWAQLWLENQQSLLSCTKSAVSALVAQHICFSLKREAVSGVCSATQGKTSPQHGHVSWSRPWVVWPFHTAGATKGGGCRSAPSPAGWADAEHRVKGLPAYVRHRPHFCYLPNTGCQTRWHKAGTHEVLQSHPRSVLLLPAIASPISHRNQMAPTWSQSMATSVLSIFKTFPWIHYSCRSFSCKVKWKPQHAPYLPDKIRAFVAQHSDTRPFLHGKSQNYQQAA